MSPALSATEDEAVMPLKLEPDADSEPTSDPIGVASLSDWGAVTTSGITCRARFCVMRRAVGEVLVGGGTYSTFVSSSISRKKGATNFDFLLRRK